MIVGDGMAEMKGKTQPALTPMFCKGLKPVAYR